MTRNFLLLSAALLLPGCSTSPRATGNGQPAAPEVAVLTPPVNTNTNTNTSANAAPPTVAASAAVVRPSELNSAVAGRRDSLIASGQRLSAEEVGYYMDVQEARFKQIASNWLRVTRKEDRVYLNLPGALSFEVGSSAISPNALEAIKSVARVLQEYRHTIITLQGHTDNVGDAAANQRISEQRALAVARVLTAAGVGAQRIVVTGYGASQPAASNDTEAGRDANRRVEIEVIPVFTRRPSNPILWHRRHHP